MAIFRPSMGGIREKPLQTSNSSFSVSTRMAPHCFSAASNTASEPAIAPVWDIAARCPMLERPDLTTTTGFTSAA